MASVKTTIVRPDHTFDWNTRPLNEVKYVEDNYMELVFESFSSEDRLTLTRIRTGDLALCTRLYNDLNDPACVLYNYKALCEANNVTYNVELIEN